MVGDILVTPDEAAHRFEAVANVLLNDVWRLASDDRPSPGFDAWLFAIPGSATMAGAAGGAIIPGSVPTARRLAQALCFYMWATFGGRQLPPTASAIPPEDRAATAELARETARRLRELVGTDGSGSTRSDHLRSLLGWPVRRYAELEWIAADLEYRAESIDPHGRPREAHRPVEAFAWFCTKVAETLWVEAAQPVKLNSEPSVERVSLFAAAARLRDPDTDDRDGRFLNLSKLGRAVKMAIRRQMLAGNGPSDPPLGPDGPA